MTSYQIANGDSGKCEACKKEVQDSELRIGVTVSYEGKDGATVWRHLACTTKNDTGIKELVSKDDHCSDGVLKGWDALKSDEQATATEALEKIKKSRAKKAAKASGDSKEKKEKGTKRKKSEPKEKKEKKEKKERKPKKKKDPNAPKRGRNAYLLFTMDKRPEVKAANPEAQPKDLLKLLAAEWAKLTAAEKVPYTEKQKEEKERYETELAAYKATKGDDDEDDDDEKPKKKKAKKTKKKKEDDDEGDKDDGDDKDADGDDDDGGSKDTGTGGGDDGDGDD